MGRALGLIRGKLVAVLAAESTDSLPWIPLSLRTQMNVMERGMDERVVGRVRIRVTRGWEE